MLWLLFPWEGTLVLIEQEVGGPRVGLDVVEERRISFPHWDLNLG
jgi:hypothetical protein